MGRIESFLEANGLRQIDLVRYLGISKPYMSNMVKDDVIPRPQLTKLLANQENWDTSMLLEPATITQTIGNGSSNNTQVAGSSDSELARLREKVELLEKLLEEKERTIQILMNR